jgi:hypothetical protein
MGIATMETPPGRNPFLLARMQIEGLLIKSTSALPIIWVNL